MTFKAKTNHQYELHKNHGYKHLKSLRDDKEMSMLRAGMGLYFMMETVMHSFDSKPLWTFDPAPFI